LLKSRIGKESSYQEDSIQKKDKSTVTSREGFVNIDQIQGQKSVQGLQLLADAASRMTPCDTSDFVQKRKVSDEFNVQDVSPVMKAALVMPKVKEIKKKKRASILDNLPDNLTSPETIRKLALKDIEKTRQFANKEKRAKATYLLKSKRSKDKQNLKKTETVSPTNENEEEAICMLCELTWKEDQDLMLGHTWIQCDKCESWIHEHCLPIDMKYDSVTNKDIDFICHKCERDK
jgi:hypothetical protein